MRIGIGLTAGGLVLAGIAAAALAQTPPVTPPARADRVKAMFAQVDANKDGYVTKAEAEAARAAMRTRMETARRERGDRAFARLDTDRNGQISRAEFDAAPRMAAMGMGKADGPRDRRSMRRMERRAGRMGAMPMFERMDADRDGRVSLAEAEAFRPHRMAMRGGRGGMQERGLLPPGHPPVPGVSPAPLSNSERPLGGGRD